MINSSLTSRKRLVGCNLAPINPRLPLELQIQVNRDILKDLAPGATVRWQTLFWEAFPTTNENNFITAGIDATTQLIKDFGMKGLCLLSPCPWVAKPGDWWMPSRDKWQSISTCLFRMINRIELANPGTLYQLANEPAGKAFDPDVNEKPGGSNRTRHGEWHDDFGDFMTMILDVLAACKIPRSRIVSPALSTIGEGGVSGAREADEIASAIRFKAPMARCGIIDVHILPRANFADNSPNPEPNKTVSVWLDYWFKRTTLLVSAFKRTDQRVICSESYAPYGQSNLPFGDPRIKHTWELIISHCQKRNWELLTWNFTDSPGSWEDFKTFPVTLYKPNAI